MEKNPLVKRKNPLIVKKAIAQRLELIRNDKGYRNVKEFSEALGITYENFLSYSRGQSEPKANFFVTMHEYGVDVEWLLTGQGDMYRAGSAGITQRTVYEHNGIAVHNNHGSIGVGEQHNGGHGGRGDRLQGFIAWWMATHDADDQVWLIKQVERAVPEFVDFDLDEQR